MRENDAPSSSFLLPQIRQETPALLLRHVKHFRRARRKLKGAAPLDLSRQAALAIEVNKKPGNQMLRDKDAIPGHIEVMVAQRPLTDKAAHNACLYRLGSPALHKDMIIVERH